jgi:hypothetical protein
MGCKYRNWNLLQTDLFSLFYGRLGHEQGDSWIVCPDVLLWCRNDASQFNCNIEPENTQLLYHFCDARVCQNPWCSSKFGHELDWKPRKHLKWYKWTWICSFIVFQETMPPSSYRIRMVLYSKWYLLRKASSLLTSLVEQDLTLVYSISNVNLSELIFRRDGTYVLKQEILTICK